jgi:Ca2+-transporting ATPase
MKRKPRDPKESVFARGLGVGVAYQGILVAGLTLLSYSLGYYVISNSNAVLATTMAFLTLSMAEVFHAFNMRSLLGSIFTMKHQNKWLWGAGAISFILTTLLVTIKPIANIFSLTTLSIAEFGIALGIAFAVIPIVELIKCGFRAYYKKKAK